GHASSGRVPRPPAAPSPTGSNPPTADGRNGPDALVLGVDGLIQMVSEPTIERASRWRAGMHVPARHAPPSKKCRMRADELESRAEPSAAPREALLQCRRAQPFLAR